VEQIKLQTLLVILGIIVAILNILDKTLALLERAELRAKQKAHIQEARKAQTKMSQPPRGWETFPSHLEYTTFQSFYE